MSRSHVRVPARPFRRGPLQQRRSSCVLVIALLGATLVATRDADAAGSATGAEEAAPVVAGGLTSARPRDVFRVGRAAPQVLVVFEGDVPRAADMAREVMGSPMLRELTGVRAIVTDRSEIGRLIRTVEAQPPPSTPTLLAGEARYTVAMLGRREDAAVRVLELPGGATAATQLDLAPRRRDGGAAPAEAIADAEGAPSALLNKSDLNFLLRTWGLDELGLDEDIPLSEALGLPPGVDADIPELAGEAPQAGRLGVLRNPLLPTSPITLDRRTLVSRINPPPGVGFKPADRELSRHRVSVRLPSGYDPGSDTIADHASRPGVLVWVDPSNGGAPPPQTQQTCDELNLIAIGVSEAGNERPAIDRFQLALDCIEIADANFGVDRSRVYVFGVSGGGRCSAMLWGCFPDVFAGAVAIVGMNSYQAVPLGGGRIWPASFGKPRGRLLQQLKTRRLAGVTGPADFNYRQTIAYAEAMKLDGMQVRVFEHEMGHTMATPDAFLEAVRWVEEPVLARRAELAASAMERLNAITERLRTDPESGRLAEGELDDETRSALVKLTIDAPWTPAAIASAELLGYGRK